MKIIAGLLAKGAIKKVLTGTMDAISAIVVDRILSRDFFEQVAIMVIKRLLLRWKHSRNNALTDDLVDEVIRRLDADPDPGGGTEADVRSTE